MAEENQRGDSGQGRGFGRGRGQGRGQGGGRRSGGMRAGGYCVCPSCGHKEGHQAGKPCFEKKCPECNTDMVRE